MATAKRRKKSKRQQGISPAGKVAILVAVFGIPILFAVSSWGLSKLYEIAPTILIIVVILAATIYTAYTASLMYKFYEAPAPILRFIPCLCELSLIDVKFRMPCYILYALAVLLFGATQLPYETMKILGSGFALNGGFYLMLLSFLLLFVIEIIKGIGLMGTMKDVEEDWKKQVHTDVGALDKMIIFGFIPFVRVIALYALSKPLDTLVSFMGVSSEDSESAKVFEEEED